MYLLENKHVPPLTESHQVCHVSGFDFTIKSCSEYNITPFIKCVWIMMSDTGKSLEERKAGSVLWEKVVGRRR